MLVEGGGVCLHNAVFYHVHVGVRDEVGRVWSVWVVVVVCTGSLQSLQGERAEEMCLISLEGLLTTMLLVL